MNYKYSNKKMKLIFSITLLLSSIILQGQDSIARIKYWSDIWAEYEYYYSINSKLDSVVKYQNDSYSTWKYSNDTLISFNYNNETENFFYTTDTVYKIYDNGYTVKFDVNGEHCFLNGGNYSWENGNCVEYVGHWSATFYEQYRNPWLHGSYYFRRSDEHGMWSGHFNLVQKVIYPDFENFNLEVIESIGEWPTKIELSWNTGMTIVNIEYYDWISMDLQETFPEHEKTLSLDYYDLMGRIITKPKKGFYIERKVTNKGTICKKYFVK